jgi:hypothetical protein
VVALYGVAVAKAWVPVAPERMNLGRALSQGWVAVAHRLKLASVAQKWVPVAAYPDPVKSWVPVARISQSFAPWIRQAFQSERRYQSRHPKK